MAGPPVRQRYNAKARGSVAGGSSHKKRKNLSKERTEEDAQDNETDQHAAVFEDPTAGMSSKKRSVSSLIWFVQVFASIWSG